MRRRRSLPWIYRWSRPIIGAIAIAGAILTAYLTITKLTGGGPACSAEAAAGAGCGGVLNSAYATVFLPLFLGELVKRIIKILRSSWKTQLGGCYSQVASP